MQRLAYPPAPSTGQIDDYHGTKIADPYRTLENADAPSTVKWVDQENALTFSWLSKFPGREKIRTQLTGLWNYEKFTRLYKAGGHYFYLHNSGLQNQSVLYVTDSLDGTARELIDPNTYRKDGTAALSDLSVSWNGELLAYAVAQAGSDWNDWHVREVATGKDLPDLLHWSKDLAIAWAPDDSGFYYTRFPEPPPDKLLTAIALNEKVYFHKLGDPQAAEQTRLRTPGSSGLDSRPQSHGRREDASALDGNLRAGYRPSRVARSGKSFVSRKGSGYGRREAQLLSNRGRGCASLRADQRRCAAWTRDRHGPAPAGTCALEGDCPRAR